MRRGVRGRDQHADRARVDRDGPGRSRPDGAAGVAVELDGHRDRYAATRDLLIRRLPEVGLRDYAPPDGAFYAWCDVGHLTDDSLTWCRDLLDDCGVAITPGVDFDTAQGHTKVRLSFAGSTAEVAEALDRMAASPLLRGRG